MGLSNKQRFELHNALLDAFREQSSLERMLSYKLDKKLNEIVKPGSLNSIVFELIQTAESEEWIENLVCAARESNDGNLKLKKIAEELLSNTEPILKQSLEDISSQLHTRLEYKKKQRDSGLEHTQQNDNDSTVNLKSVLHKTYPILSTIKPFISIVLTFSGLVIFMVQCNRISEQERIKNTQPRLPLNKTINYTLLEKLLNTGNWQASDVETSKKMLEVFVGNEKSNQTRHYLNQEDIQAFPCKDLLTIDKLWVKYSKGRFGFSVQRKLWKDIDNSQKPGTYKGVTEYLFGKRVGWNVNDKWLSYPEHNFTLKANEGHLPKNLFQNFENQNQYTYYDPLRDRLDSLFLRLDICQPSSDTKNRLTSTLSQPTQKP